MPKVTICINVEEQHLREYQAEADRRGVQVEVLIEQTVNVLLAELEQQEREGPWDLMLLT